MREDRKKKRLEGVNCNNVPKRTKLSAERQHDYRKCKAQEKTQENKTSKASTSTDMDVARFKTCVTCTETLNGDQVPSLSSSDGFVYPPYPMHLPPLDCISERLVAPRLSFMRIIFKCG
jgi:hypothetical protein